MVVHYILYVFEFLCNNCNRKGYNKCVFWCQMMSALLYQCCRLSFAILYPTYSSFKAVRGKNVREYVSTSC